MRQRVLFGEQEEEAEINMTPMLDVVFIMLIFFIVSTSFVRESGIEIERPAAESSDSQNKAAVMIALTESADIWMDRQPIDIRMVRPTVERLKAEQTDLQVVVQADEKSSTGHLVKLLDQLRMANVPYVVATSKSQ